MLVLTYLQTTHHLSRRNIVDLIKQGKILINGKPIESFKHELNEGDNVQIINTLKGGKNETMEGSIQTINPESLLSSSQKDNLLLFNKPKGYVVSKSDPHNPTIYELLPPEFQHYYYIGRLDKESRGLVLLTNTPALVHQYEHPSFNIIKEYLIQLSSPLSLVDQQKTKHGIHDEGEFLKFKDITPTTIPNQYKIVLNEGKKRHIRRVIKSLGYELFDLQRIKEGEWELGNLKEGEWKTT